MIFLIDAEKVSDKIIYQLTDQNILNKMDIEAKYLDIKAYRTKS